MKKFKRFILLLPLLSTLFLTSCYYDYGVDTENSDIVVTFYNKEYNFGAVTKYCLNDTVKKIGSSSISSAYDVTILQTVKNNLNALGWQEVGYASADVIVGTGVTTSTYVVSSGWYDYWGYYWYYPPYYYDTYSYTTGTIAVLMADKTVSGSGQQAIQWSGILNGLVGTGNSQKIVNGINQAFSQSPYLK